MRVGGGLSLGPQPEIILPPPPPPPAGFTLGATQPTALNTGLSDPTLLTVVNAPLDSLGVPTVVLGTPGQVYRDKDVYGFIRVTANDVTIENCRVRGALITEGNRGLVSANQGGVLRTMIRRCLLQLATVDSSVWVVGVVGSNFTVERCEITGTIDGVKVSGPGNVKIRGNYIHDTVQFAVDPNRSGGPSHNDGIQFLSGQNMEVIGNHIVQKTTDNPCMQMSQLADPLESSIGFVTILYNWFIGGGAALPSPPAAGVQVLDTPRTGVGGPFVIQANRFAAGAMTDYRINWSVSPTAGATLTTGGNVLWPEGTLVPIRRNGVITTDTAGPVPPVELSASQASGVYSADVYGTGIYGGNP